MSTVKRPNRLSDFLNGIATANLPAVSGVGEWVFHPGMLFSGRHKWWGNSGLRPFPHEGLDILFYRDRDGIHRLLWPGARIPAMTDGEVVNVCTDFLGKSIVVLNAACTTKDTRVVCVYAHLTPDNRIEKGLPLKKGELIAAIPPAAGDKSPVPPHLHLTVAEVPKCIPFRRMNWELFGGISKEIRLINPVRF